jgi:predicted MFS family arabinose efflux permease
MLSIGGLAGVIARITIGVRVDNRARTGIGTVAAMVATGSLGLLLLSLPGSAARVGGVVIVFALGWGWVGLFQYLLVSANRSNPGAATGLTDTGGYLGASAGPAAIGVLAERWSFAGVWRLAAGGAVLGALLIRAAGAVARRARRPIEVSGSDRPPAEPER